MKEKAREKGRARKKKDYQIVKRDHPEILQMKARAQKNKCLEDVVYGEKYAQQSRTSKNKSRTTSKNFAIVSGTFRKHLSLDGGALLQSRYIAWKGSHSTMRGFYTKLSQDSTNMVSL